MYEREVMETFKNGGGRTCSRKHTDKDYVDVLFDCIF